MSSDDVDNLSETQLLSGTDKQQALAFYGRKINKGHSTAQGSALQTKQTVDLSNNPFPVHRRSQNTS